MDKLCITMLKQYIVVDDEFSNITVIQTSDYEYMIKTLGFGTAMTKK